ncbi:hypothetical protein [Legionella gresilensis]|uniref:hypothetical protein n=1 Tax=Legionella gresilensis TaxID=91823 RepID=UPI0010410828|nr:hypothetical protein [Legionella gresilensis]
MPTNEPTPTTAFISSGILGANILLICCYHGSEMDSRVFYSQYAQQLDKGPKKNSPKKLSKVPIANGKDYDLIEKSILTELKKLKEQLEDSKQEFKEVYFYADVNLCCVEKADIAKFLMDDTLATIFGESVPVRCVLETTLVEVAKKAADYHQTNYTTKVTIRTKPEGSKIKFSYPDDKDHLNVDIACPNSASIDAKVLDMVNLSETKLPVGKSSSHEIVKTSCLDTSFPLMKKSLSVDETRCPIETYPGKKYEDPDEVYKPTRRKNIKPMDKISFTTLEVGQSIERICKPIHKLEEEVDKDLKDFKRRRRLEELQRDNDAIDSDRYSTSDCFRND